MRKKQIEEVKAHYDADPALEWQRLEVNREEFLLTTCMMDRYIKPGDSVLVKGSRGMKTEEIVSALLAGLAERGT